MVYGVGCGMRDSGCGVDLESVQLESSRLKEPFSVVLL